MAERNLIIQCVKAFNGEYSVKGIARILTGYHGFKFIPKLKKSKLYGICSASEEDAILTELDKMKEEGLIVVKDNYKVFTTDLLEVLSDETIEFVRPEFAPRGQSSLTQTEDLLHVIYGEGTENELLSDNTKKIINLIENKNNIFVTGGAGTGKSYILNQLRLYYRNKLHVTSTTGISALNISGQTIHSWAGIGIADKPVDYVVSRIRKNPILLKQILLAELLAIDEISMLDNDTFDYLNDVLKAVRKDKRPFGGIQMLLFGDFFQLPPVGIEKDSNIDFCFNSHSWDELSLKTVLLKEVKRQSDEEFIKALNNVREDKTDTEDMKVFFKCDYDFDYEPSRDILQIFSTNNRADAYNAQCYAELETEPFQYISQDELFIYNRDQEAYSINLDSTEANRLSEFDRNCVKRFNEDCRAPHILDLKVGCRVMLVKNQNVKAGLVNGSCGTVSHLTQNSITVLFDNGVEVNVTPEKFEYIRENRPKVRRRQFPLRLAYGITIHKSQGMTFDKLVVNFNRIFDYGQAYVALSRTRSMEGLIIKGFDPNKIKANPKVIAFYKNIEENGTYLSILQDKYLKEIRRKEQIFSTDYTDEELCELIVECVRKFNNVYIKSMIPKILTGSEEFFPELSMDRLVIESKFFGIVKNRDTEYLSMLIDKLIDKGVLKTIDGKKWSKIYTADLDNNISIEQVKITSTTLDKKKPIDKNKITILKCLSMFDGETTRTGIARILAGSHSSRLTDEQKCSKFYGLLKCEEIKYLRKIIEDLLFEGYIKENGEWNRIALTQKGKKTIQE